MKKALYAVLLVAVLGIGFAMGRLLCTFTRPRRVFRSTMSIPCTRRIVRSNRAKHRTVAWTWWRSTRRI